MSVFIKTESIPISCTLECENYKCPICSFETALLVDLKKHTVDACTIDIPIHSLYCCGSCKFGTHSRFIFLLHKRLHKVELKKRPRKTVWFNCEYCSVMLNNEEDLAQHQLYEHAVTSDIHWLRCQYCSYKSSPENVAQHIKLRHPFFSCKYCSYTSKNSRSLRCHVGATHDRGIGKFKCEYCGFKCKTRRSLIEHLKYMHTPDDKIKWFHCEKCYFRTKRESYLKQHVAKLHGEDGIGWFPCGQCGSKFTEKIRLDVHVQTTHENYNNVRRFNCKYCSYKTTRGAYLWSHIKKRHGNEYGLQWFPCEYCTFKAKHSISLKIHVTMKHKNVKEK